MGISSPKPRLLSPPSAVRGFGMSTAGGAAVISVSVSHNDTVCTIEAEGMNYSPDVLDDLVRRAAAGVAALMIQLLEAVEDE